MSLTSIIIPTHQHAHVLGEAIEAALAQTAPVEVIVVDDGSTDRTAELLAGYRQELRIRTVLQTHRGVSAARNAGLELAQGAFVMFLDADDVIAPTKVAEQLEVFDEHTGWVLCDVSIADEARKTLTTASAQYDYAHTPLDGWIADRLRQSNFIPIMAPLVRREVLRGLAFSDTQQPEDWHFWIAVADVARARYLPRVLATYRHGKTGRSRQGRVDDAPLPSPRPPIRLNLGCGQRRKDSWHPLPGLVNLDQSLGWRFEDGLSRYRSDTVAGITISHALMFLPEAEWPRVFAEFARVLAPGGVIRITEDDATNPCSARLGGWRGSEPAVTLTDAARVVEALEAAGLAAHVVTDAETYFEDRSLCQAFHGRTPDVYFVEGVKPAHVLFAPHADDEGLFAAFTIIQHRPRVVICCPSTGDYGETAVRTRESRAAVGELGGGPVEQWDGRDLETKMRALDAAVHPQRVFAPNARASHPDHRAVSAAAATVFGDRLVTYHTYDAGQKVTGTPVPFEPSWLGRKLRALSRYETQLAHQRAHRFFAADLLEYFGDTRC